MRPAEWYIRGGLSHLKNGRIMYNHRDPEVTPTMDILRKFLHVGSILVMTARTPQDYMFDGRLVEKMYDQVRYGL